jgi:hypothetical protein
MKEGSHDDRLMLALKVSKPLTGAPGVLASLISTEAAGLSAAGWSGGPVDGLGTVGDLVNLSGAGGLGGPMPGGVPALNMSQVGGSTHCGIHRIINMQARSCSSMPCYATVQLPGMCKAAALLAFGALRSSRLAAVACSTAASGHLSEPRL